jgi:hypothetical protein
MSTKEFFIFDLERIIQKFPRKRRSVKLREFESALAVMCNIGIYSFQHSC